MCVLKQQRLIASEFKILDLSKTSKSCLYSKNQLVELFPQFVVFNLRWMGSTRSFIEFARGKITFSMHQESIETPKSFINLAFLSSPKYSTHSFQHLQIKFVDF